MFRTTVLCRCGLLLALLPGTNFGDDAGAADALTVEVAALADDFARIIKKHGGGAVAIGEFSASSDIKGSAGPRVQLVLKQELERRDISVNSEQFRFEIKGDYQPIVDKKSSHLGVKLIGRLIDRETGEPLAEKPTGRFVFGVETVPAMLGLNVSGPPTSDTPTLSDRFKAAQARPQVQVQGTTIAGTSGEYAVELLVKQQDRYTARAVEADNAGRPFVMLNVSEVYGVRLINKSPRESAVELCIDGVNCFQFSDQAARFWILAPGKSIDVLGWHLNDETTREFKVVADFPESAAAKLHLQPSATIGLITASFSACWENESQRPADEPLVETRAATGFGAEIKFRTQGVTRQIGLPRDTIAVRYQR